VQTTANRSVRLLPREWMLAAVAVLCSPSLCSQTTATEDQVRSAFLYQVAQFVNWPADSLPAEGRALRFCVLGHDTLADTLTVVVRGKSIDGREIEVSKIDRVNQLADCHAAFIGYLKQKQLTQLFAHWKYPPVLLVGEGVSFLEAGGMVALEIESGRVSFAVNLAVTRQAGLSMRSQLLRLARLLPAGAQK